MQDFTTDNKAQNNKNATKDYAKEACKQEALIQDSTPPANGLAIKDSTQAFYTQKFQTIAKELSNGIYEREGVIKLALLAFLSKKSIFLYGPPGTAKSMIARRIALAFSDAESSPHNFAQDSINIAQNTPSLLELTQDSKRTPINTLESLNAESTPTPRAPSLESAQDSMLESKEATHTTQARHTTHTTQPQTHFFSYLMNRFSTPDEVFGPIDIGALRQNELKRVTSGYLPSARFAFLDEIWKSSPAILNTLLTIINEKIYRDGSADYPVPLVGLVCASNEFPAPNSGLEALYDRLLVRLCVPPLQKKNSLKALLTKPTNVPELTQSFSPRECEEIYSKAKNVCFESSALDMLFSLRNALHCPESSAINVDSNDMANATNALESSTEIEQDSIYISDRRLKQIAELLQVAVFLSGRESVSALDVALLEHCVWQNNSQIPYIRALLVGALIGQSVDKKFQNALAKIEKDIANIKTNGLQFPSEYKEVMCQKLDSLDEEIELKCAQVEQKLEGYKEGFLQMVYVSEEFKKALESSAKNMLKIYQKDSLKIEEIRTLLPHTKPMLRYKPQTRSELMELVKNESVNLGEIDISLLSDLSQVFRNSTRKDFSGLEYWDTSHIQDMRYMFCNAKYFNRFISSWDFSGFNSGGLSYLPYNGMFSGSGISSGNKRKWANKLGVSAYYL